MNIRVPIAVIKSTFCNYFAAQMVQNFFPCKCITLSMAYSYQLFNRFLEIHAA